MTMSKGPQYLIDGLRIAASRCAISDRDKTVLLDSAHCLERQHDKIRRMVEERKKLKDSKKPRSSRNTCDTCESLSRAVMMDQVGNA